MYADSKFYRCAICGNLVYLIDQGKGTLVCCGQPMDKLIANTTDASMEKHVPVTRIDGNTVTIKIGSEPHPMLPEHHIEWVFIEGAASGCLYYLKIDGQPEISVPLPGDKPVTVYAYCNIHGLFAEDV